MSCFTLSINAQEIINVKKAESTIIWKGSNLFKFNQHYGTVKIKKGYLEVSKNGVFGGAFEIDMNSITNTDGKYNDMLVSHLKNEDFFDVKNHPISKIKFIKIMKTAPNEFNIRAALTIKGITNKIDFRGTLKNENGESKIHSKFIIDRTLWGIHYESKGVFGFGKVKDDIISDAIEFEVELSFPKTLKLQLGC